MKAFLVGAAILLHASMCTTAQPAGPGGPTDLGFELHFLSDPLAVCNDGSPGGYYVQKGMDTSRWVIHQQGGWWCWDEYSCQVRWDWFENTTGATPTSEKRHLMSSKTLAKRTSRDNKFNGERNTGLFSPDPQVNSDFYNASKVFIAYCSSDSHAGDASPSAKTAKWHFRGKRIVHAVVQGLLELHGLENARDVVLTGGSAGGMATFANADSVLEQIRNKIPSVNFLAFPDAGWFSDVAPNRVCNNPEVYECACVNANTCGYMPMSEAIMKMAEMHNGQLDQSCMETYGLALGPWGKWRCYLAEYAVQHISAPLLVNQMQTDAWQEFYNGFSNRSSSEENKYAAWFRAQSRVAFKMAPPSVRFFSPVCDVHTFAASSNFFSITVDGYSSKDALRAALLGGSVPSHLLDDCDGLNCSPGCPHHGVSNSGYLRSSPLTAEIEI